MHYPPLDGVHVVKRFNDGHFQPIGHAARVFPAALMIAGQRRGRATPAFK